MRHPNGYGTVFKLSGNRRRPYVARKTAGFNEAGNPIYEVIGYFEKQSEAMLALAKYNENPHMIGNDKITFAELYEIYKAAKFTDKTTKSTINGYNQAFNNSPSLHGMKFAEIKTAHLNAAIKKCKLGHGSLKKMKVLYNQLYEYAMTNDIVEKDYSQYVKIDAEAAKPNRRPFTQDEITALFKAEPSLPYTDAILIMIYTGVRPSELLNIRTNDVVFDEDYFIVTDSKTEAGQNRLVPISAKIKPFIERRLAEGHEFLITYNDKKLGYDYFYRSIFAQIMEQLGMQHRPHDCRHTFATLLNNADANPTSIKNLIGHTSFALTEKTYTHKDIEELRKAVDAI